MTGNQSELADFLGIHKATVSRAVRAGRLLAEPDGSFDFEKSAARWHATVGGRADVAARHAAQRGAGIPTGHRSAQNAPAAAESRGGSLEMPADDGAAKRLRSRQQAELAVRYGEPDAGTFIPEAALANVVVRDDGGTVLGSVAMGRDATARYLAEQERLAAAVVQKP